MRQARFRDPLACPGRRSTRPCGGSGHRRQCPTSHLAHAGIGNCAIAVATVLLVDPDAETRLPAVRDVIGRERRRQRLDRRDFLARLLARLSANGRAWLASEVDPAAAAAQRRGRAAQNLVKLAPPRRAARGIFIAIDAQGGRTSCSSPWRRFVARRRLEARRPSSNHP